MARRQADRRPAGLDRRADLQVGEEAADRRRPPPGLPDSRRCGGPRGTEESAPAERLEGRGRPSRGGPQQARSRRPTRPDHRGGNGPGAANDVDRAWTLLEDCPARLRRWEWHYLRRLCHGEFRTIQGHRRRCLRRGVRPETSYFTCHDPSGGGPDDLGCFDRPRGLPPSEATTARPSGLPSTRRGPGSWRPGAMGSSRIWDVATGRLVRTLTGHGEWAAAVAFSPDGTRIASGGADRAVRISNALDRQGASGPSRATRGASWEWPSAPTASTWYRRASMVRSCPGMPERAGRSADSPAISWANPMRGLQPRRLPPGIRRVRPLGQDLGRGTGREILTFRAATARVDGLAFSPDG